MKPIMNLIKGHSARTPSLYTHILTKDKRWRPPPPQM